MIVTAFLFDDIFVSWMQHDESLDAVVPVKDTPVRFSRAGISVFYLYTPLLHTRQQILEKLYAFLVRNAVGIGRIVVVDWYNGFGYLELGQDLLKLVDILYVLPSRLYDGFEGRQFTSLFVEKTLQKFAFSHRNAIFYSVYPSFLSIFRPFRYFDGMSSVDMSCMRDNQAKWSDNEIKMFEEAWVQYGSGRTLYVGVPV